MKGIGILLERQPPLDDYFLKRMTTSKDKRHLNQITVEQQAFTIQTWYIFHAYLSGIALAMRLLLLFNPNPGFKVFYPHLFSFQFIFQFYHFINEIVYF